MARGYFRSVAVALLRVWVCGPLGVFPMVGHGQPDEELEGDDETGRIRYSVAAQAGPPLAQVRPDPMCNSSRARSALHVVGETSLLTPSLTPSGDFCFSYRGTAAHARFNSDLTSSIFIRFMNFFLRHLGM